MATQAIDQLQPFAYFQAMPRRVVSQRYIAGQFAPRVRICLMQLLMSVLTAEMLHVSLQVLACIKSLPFAMHTYTTCAWYEELLADFIYVGLYRPAESLPWSASDRISFALERFFARLASSDT
jgi:hypothetical protein